MINTRFGTHRGLIRLALSYPQYYLGPGRLPPPDRSAIRRLVFVCRGNISRSAFANALCQRRGMASASFGLATAGGQSADPVAVGIAAEFGVDMAAHRASEVGKFVPHHADLLLPMEMRQLHMLAGLPLLSHLPRELLGGYAGTPHLHDPFTLSEGYYRTCFARIVRAVDRLEPLYPNARLSG